MTRTCGGCTACCKLLAVPELNKPENTRCKHSVMGKGCMIYKRRPGSCRHYACLWLCNEQALPGDEARPDKCGFVVDVTVDGKVLIITFDQKHEHKATSTTTLLGFIDRFNTRYSIALIKAGSTDPITVYPAPGKSEAEVKLSLASGVVYLLEEALKAVSAGKMKLSAEAEIALREQLVESRAYLLREVPQ